MTGLGTIVKALWGQEEPLCKGLSLQLEFLPSFLPLFWARNSLQALWFPSDQPCHATPSHAFCFYVATAFSRETTPIAVGQGGRAGDKVRKS